MQLSNFQPIRTGSFDVKSRRWRKSIVSTLAKDLATALQEETNYGVQKCSARGIAGSLGMLVSTEQKSVRNILYCYSYKITHVRELFIADLL